jgi:hypothetical protein
LSKIKLTALLEYLLKESYYCCEMLRAQKSLSLRRQPAKAQGILGLGEAGLGRFFTAAWILQALAHRLIAQLTLTVRLALHDQL